MSSNPTKLGCGTGSWECYNPDGSTGCYDCPSTGLFGVCTSGPGETCSYYGRSREPPGTVPNCGKGWQACTSPEAGGITSCYACKGGEDCEQTPELECKNHGFLPASSRFDTRHSPAAMSSNPTKLGCGTGSWECYNDDGSKGCFPCTEFWPFGLCKNTAAEICGHHHLRPTRFDTRHDTKPGQPCTSNSDCIVTYGPNVPPGGACGRMGNSDSPLVCCPQPGGNTTVLLKDYCVGLYSPPGTPCRSDDQCQSGNCSGNLGGLQDGECSR